LADSKVTSRKMTASLQEHFDKVFGQLQNDGLLLAWHSNLPSLTHLITEETIRGSWWSHKLAHTIFNVAEMLEDHPDVMIMKLVSGKVTFVHRKLWKHIYSVGVAREDWQLNNLSTDARRLLAALDEAGLIQTYKLREEFGPRPGDRARELESRILIHGQQVHTESGRHSKLIETWPAWAKRAGFRARTSDPAAARRFLEERLATLNKNHNGNAELPWPSTV
jgi:hypothetical protein